MTHKAKRIAPGLYEYRGHEIEDMRRWDEDAKSWNIRELTEDSAHDAENTLRQAKALIDWWMESR